MSIMKKSSWRRCGLQPAESLRVHIKSLKNSNKNKSLHANDLRRRLLVAGAAWPVFPWMGAAPSSALAQKQSKVWRIGGLMEGEPADYARALDAFKLGLRELGYVDGRDYVIEQRAASGDMARLRTLAGELIALKVDLIVSTGTPSALAARDATREIPILITTVGDPVGSGLAASLRRPGGNVTGLTQISSELVSKRLDLLRQIVPGLRRVGFLYDPNNASLVLEFKQLQSDCTKLGYTLIEAPVRKGEGIMAAFSALRRDKAQGLIVADPAWFRTWIVSIIEQATKHRLPAIFSLFLSSERGGLVTYSVNSRDLSRRTAAYADKIFKGAKPGELPIEMPTRFDLVINLKTAKALGIAIPPSVMVQATRVIE
jgi:putative tryptophan/tyrosine transport system substrate-binding protein